MNFEYSVTKDNEVILGKDNFVPDFKEVDEKTFLEIKEKLKEVVLPESCTIVRAKAFAGYSKLSKIVFSNINASIEEYAFDGCRNLSEVELPSQLKIIPEGIFRNCKSLQKVSGTENVTTIKRNAFAGSHIQSLKLPKLTNINQCAFEGCEFLTEIELPVGTKSVDISDNAFKNIDHRQLEFIIPEYLGEEAVKIDAILDLRNKYFKKNSFWHKFFFEEDLITPKIWNGFDVLLRKKFLDLAAIQRGIVQVVGLEDYRKLSKIQYNNLLVLSSESGLPTDCFDGQTLVNTWYLHPKRKVYIPYSVDIEERLSLEKWTEYIDLLFDIGANYVKFTDDLGKSEEFSKEKHISGNVSGDDPSKNEGSFGFDKTNDSKSFSKSLKHFRLEKFANPENKSGNKYYWFDKETEKERWKGTKSQEFDMEINSEVQLTTKDKVSLNADLKSLYGALKLKGSKEKTFAYGFKYDKRVRIEVRFDGTVPGPDHSEPNKPEGNTVSSSSEPETTEKKSPDGKKKSELKEVDLSSPVLNYRPDVSGLVARTNLTEELYNRLQNNQFVNMTGIGGMGKTSLSYLFVNDYADKYNKIAYVLVNNDFYEELDKEFGRFFGIKRNVKVELTFEENKLDGVQKDNLPFLNKLISSFENISGHNLLIIDVNESANYHQVSEAIDVMRRRGMKNWKVLIIARVKIFSNVVEFTPFEIGGCDLKVAKSIFFNYLKDKDKSKDYQYSDDDFMDLFDTLFYSPLLIEQLAKYLLRNRSRLSKKDILNYIKGDGKEYGLQQQKLNSGTIDEQRLAKYEIINIFLSHLSEFSELDAMYKKDNQLRDIVRHMMLWEADYYSIDTIFTFVKGLTVSEDVLREALDCLCDLCVLDYSKSKNGYKMHGLMAKTFRKQVLEDVANSDFRDYSQYFKNIIELGCVVDEDSQIAKCVYATLGNKYFMEKYYWKTLSKKEILDKELEREYNMVKVEGHDFYICKYAVSQGDWLRIYKDPNNNPSHFQNGDDYPVECVSWYDAMLYIMKLNDETGLCFRLPSEEEWEWACEYSNADKRNVDDVAWYEGNSGRSTHPVGETPTPISDDDDHGIKNMLGNVWEWCYDRYTKGGSNRVRRGGSWYTDADNASSSSCGYSDPCDRGDDLGFRLALQFKK